MDVGTKGFVDCIVKLRIQVVAKKFPEEATRLLHYKS